MLSALLPAWTSFAWTSVQETTQKKTVLRATLNNGLRVVIVPDTLAPVATIVVNYRVGSNQAPANFPGTAHALEHMMFRGSPGLSEEQLANVTAAIGGFFNADTQQTVTQYFFTVPVQDLDVALHIESLRMRAILSDEKSWSQERGAIEQEVAQDLSNPEYVAYTKLLANLFRGTPYAHTPLGARPSFDKTSAAMLKKFHDTWYAPNNAVLVIVGDVQPQDTLIRVKRLFEDIPAGKILPAADIRLQPVNPETFDLKTDLPYGLIMMAFRLPGSDSPDFAAVQVLADVLNSERGNLYGLVTEGKALSVGFSTSTFPQTAMGYVVAAFPKEADAVALIEAVRNILAADVQSGFPPDLIEAAKRQEITAAELEKNSMFGLAMAWSQAVAVEGRRSPTEKLEAIRRVSTDDVRAAASKYLNPLQTVVAVLTPQASGKAVSSRASRKVESFALKETAAVKIPKWAQKSWHRLEIPASNVHPTVTTLPNGLRLIVQPENVSRTVSVYGHIRNHPEVTEPRGQEGVNLVLEALFSYGTDSLDRLAFQKGLDDIGAVESAGSDFSLQVLSDHFDRGVRLLADHVLHPALPQKGFRIVRQQVAATVSGRLQSPNYLRGRALRQAIFPQSDPTLRQATQDSVMGLRLPDVRAYHQKIYRPDLTTIVIIGNVTVETVRAVMLKYFGPWEARGPKPDVLLPSVPDNKPSVVAVPNDTQVQDRVILAETLQLKRSDPDYYALELGNHVLGGGFYATRLYRDLREKTGLVYHIDASFDVSKTRALYIVRYACDPLNVSLAHTIIRRNLQDMQTDLVTPEELKVAKAMALREIPLSESSLAGVASGFISRTELDLPLQEPHLAAQNYLALTADQVRAAFARRLRPEDLVRVTEGPKPE
ncbi:MAG: insulinase family protein [Desulfobacterales bacterium]|nr:MAG: insulinase family protein [Desulfobacterales bacterium]